MKNIESHIQQSCVKWFRYQYPKHLIISIPNGGNRNAITGAILKAEGATAGAPDLFLFHANQDYHGLAIEVKTEKGRQSVSQVEFQKRLENAGYKYVIIRGFDDFLCEIECYLLKTKR